MGFCLLNNVAVTAAVLADRGERVLVVDWDAHHGNGTQDAFYADDRVLYVSLHEYPLYPYTGRLDETGTGAGAGPTVNVPLPAGATGDVALAALDEVVAPAVEAFGPTWLLVSAGFDGHRRDPLTGLGFSSGDFADLTRRVLEWAPPGRRIALPRGRLRPRRPGRLGRRLRGRPGRASTTGPSASTAGGPGRAVVDAAVLLRSSRTCRSTRTLHHRQGPPQCEARHRRHPDARVDDHLPGADARRGERRRQRRAGRCRRGDAVGRDGGSLPIVAVGGDDGPHRAVHRGARAQPHGGRRSGSPHTRGGIIAKAAAEVAEPRGGEVRRRLHRQRRLREAGSSRYRGPVPVLAFTPVARTRSPAR